MTKQLRIWLPDDWQNVSDENPDGPPTFCWYHEDATGAFQVSTAEYTKGAEPLPDHDELVKFALKFGREHHWVTAQKAYAGDCVFGSYGSALFTRTEDSSDDTLFLSQIWCLSNGLDFIFAAFIAMSEPRDEELEAAQLVAEGLDFS